MNQEAFEALTSSLTEIKDNIQTKNPLYFLNLSIYVLPNNNTPLNYDRFHIFVPSLNYYNLSI